MTGLAVLFLLAYAVTLLVQRIEEMVEAGEELERRAKGARRPFELMH